MNKRQFAKLVKLLDDPDLLERIDAAGGPAVAELLFDRHHANQAPHRAMLIMHTRGKVNEAYHALDEAQGAELSDWKRAYFALGLLAGRAEQRTDEAVHVVVQMPETERRRVVAMPAAAV